MFNLDLTNISLAELYELRDALWILREKGKFINTIKATRQIEEGISYLEKNYNNGSKDRIHSVFSI